MDLSRRSFLQGTAIGAAAITGGCSAAQLQSTGAESTATARNPRTTTTTSVESTTQTAIETVTPSPTTAKDIDTPSATTTKEATQTEQRVVIDTGQNLSSEKIEIPSPPPFRTVTLADVQPAPSDHQVAVGIEMIEESVTEEHTAQLRTIFLNKGPSRAFSFGSSRYPVTPRRSTEETPGLILNFPCSTGQAYCGTSPDDCWEVAQTNNQTEGLNAILGIGLDSGEAITHDLKVYGDSQVDGCFEPRKYRFTNSYNITKRSGETIEGDWGFTLSVKSPSK